jgi:hypothetical protein
LALSTLFLSPNLAEKYSELSKFQISRDNMNNLSLLLINKYNIETTIIFNNRLNSTVSLSIKSKSIFSNLVRPYMLNSQFYLLDVRILQLNLFLPHNTKRSFSTGNSIFNLKYTSEYKNEYILTPLQKEVLIGIILGDGFLERAKISHNTRLRIEQSYPEKEEYLRHLYDLFEPMAGKTPTIITRKRDKRTSVIYKSISFKTLAMPCLNYYHDLFYRDKVKISPNNLDKSLTARGLAY